MSADTLARRLGTTTHVSPLRMKARRLGLGAPGNLERLAIQRGCSYHNPQPIIPIHQFEVFTVSEGGGEAMAELNRFLGGHRVIGVEKHLVMTGAAGAVWVFCVEYLRGPAPEGKGYGGSAAPKIDYREVLSPEDFAVFSRLREGRQALAERDGVPPYSVFTNEQLACIVRQKVTEKAGLGKIDGVGAARLEKYGAAVLEALATAIPAAVTTSQPGGAA